MDGVSIKIERNYMRKGADNTLASMALIVALSILLVMAMTNPFQDREPNQESTTVPVATSETSGLAAVTICEGELAYFEPVEIHIQTEETPVMAMMEIELPEATAAAACGRNPPLRSRRRIPQTICSALRRRSIRRRERM